MLIVYNKAVFRCSASLYLIRHWFALILNMPCTRAEQTLLKTLITKKETGK